MQVAFLAALVFFHSSEFLLALWSTGKPDLRSVHRLCRTGGTSLHNAASNAPPLPHLSRQWCLRILKPPALLRDVPQIGAEDSQEPPALLWSPAAPDSHAAFLVSRENLLAMAATLTEYALETALFPALKRRLWPVASSICTSYFALSTCDTLPRCLCSHAPPSPLHPTPPLFFPSPNPPFPSSNPSYEHYEEFYMHLFFGLEYARYAASVPSGIPFVS
ncbi:unnamed protein product [Closterium sp. NIES-65]|nr:unnamed protein product [Closterium sp. NIES-65]